MTFSRDKLVVWFIDNFPDYYSDMLDSQHYVDRFQPNIFHSEGSIWTHTMMVMTWIESKYYSDENPIEQDYVVLITSGLLHDLGKPTCEEMNEANDTKPIRNSFKGHEGVSVLYGIEVLKKLQEDFPEIYSDETIEFIIKVVGTHGVAIEGSNSRFRTLREKFRVADKKGAIRQVDEGLFSQYSGRKFSPIGKIDDSKEVVFMVGVPCSGKSTYIKNNLEGYIIVSRDTELMNWHKSKTNKDMSYSDVYKEVHNDNEMESEFNNYFQHRLGEISKNYDKVVIDMTMMPMSSRRKMMNRFPKHSRKCIVMMTDLVTLKERNMYRQQTEGKNIPDFVFLNMAKSFTYPVKEEGFVDIKLVIN